MTQTPDAGAIPDDVRKLILDAFDQWSETQIVLGTARERARTRAFATFAIMADRATRAQAVGEPVGWTTSSRLAVLRDNPTECVTLWGSPATWRDAPLYASPVQPKVSVRALAGLVKRAQQALNQVKATGENPTAQRALEYRLAECINILSALSIPDKPAPAEREDAFNEHGYDPTGPEAGAGFLAQSPKEPKL